MAASTGPAGSPVGTRRRSPVRSASSTSAAATSASIASASGPGTIRRRPGSTGIDATTKAGRESGSSVGCGARSTLGRSPGHSPSGSSDADLVRVAACSSTPRVASSSRIELPPAMDSGPALAVQHRVGPAPAAGEGAPERWSASSIRTVTSASAGRTSSRVGSSSSSSRRATASAPSLERQPHHGVVAVRNDPAARPETAAAAPERRLRAGRARRRAPGSRRPRLAGDGLGPADAAGAADQLGRRGHAESRGEADPEVPDRAGGALGGRAQGRRRGDAGGRERGAGVGHLQRCARSAGSAPGRGADCRRSSRLASAAFCSSSTISRSR